MPNPRRSAPAAPVRPVAAPPATTSAPATRSAVRHLLVDDAHEGQRLDNFLAAVCRDVPRSRLHRIIRSGEVRINGARVSAERRVQRGDDVRVPPLRAGDAVRAAHGSEPPAGGARVAPLELPAVYEDDWLLVVDKPAGLAVHGGSGVAAGVIERLRAARPQARFLELAHRIDRDTSGLLMVAKRRGALVSLHAQLRDGLVRKRYRAIARGAWGEAWRTLQQPLHKYVTAAGERRVAVQAGGMAARTRARRVAALELPGLGAFALVDVEIDTGRTHQIRVHMSHAGAPLAGDDKYGDFELNRRLAQAGWRRMFLHAHALRLAHPADAARELALEAPLPAEFASFARAGGVEL